MYNNLGLAYEQSGRIQDAIAMFEQALSRNARYLKARINLQRMTRLAKRTTDDGLEESNGTDTVLENGADPDVILSEDTDENSDEL
jgi:hypothetical protein